MVRQGFVYSFKMFDLFDRKEILNAPSAPLEKLEKISREFETRWKKQAKAKKEKDA